MDLMTSLVIEQIETGKAPFLQNQEPGERYLPFNPTTQKEYAGINALYLMSVREQAGYADHRWLTQKQAATLGVQITPGETGVPILYWKTTERVPVKDSQGHWMQKADGTLQHELIPLEKPKLASALVFNGDQLLGLPEAKRRVVASQILVQSGVQIEYGKRAAYPVGSTGAAKEELRTVMASLFVGGKLGIGHESNSFQTYGSTWANLLKADPKELFRAAKDADQMAQLALRQGQLQTQAIQQGEPILTLEKTIPLPVRSTERFYLDVPYTEKAEAKALGARWDRQEKSWYVPQGVELDAFAQWPHKQAGVQLNLTDRDPLQQFERALKADGLILTSPVEPTGKLVRMAVEGDQQGEKSGAYLYYPDGHPAGFIQNYKTGVAYNWKADQASSGLSALDRARLEAEAVEKQNIREQARVLLAEQTAGLVANFLSTCPMAETHPYLSQKGVASHGLILNTQGPLTLNAEQSWSHTGDLLVPIFNSDRQLISAQAIAAGGRKSFPQGSQVKGGHFVMGHLGATDRILFAEGYSTGATLHALSGGLPVVVTFSAANMPAVAKAIHAQHPDKLLLFAGDNEHTKPIAKNVGLNKSAEAARLVDGYILLPEFPRGAEGSDWNDLVMLKGLDASRQALIQGIRTAEVKAERHRVALFQTPEAQQSRVRSLDEKQEDVHGKRNSRTRSR
jgi:phage/plasmid primase-like uncharacterized protein/antirestriction protein ArdC